jgi:hypothetical protein
VRGVAKRDLTISSSPLKDSNFETFHCILSNVFYDLSERKFMNSHCSWVRLNDGHVYTNDRSN